MHRAVAAGLLIAATAFLGTAAAAPSAGVDFVDVGSPAGFGVDRYTLVWADDPLGDYDVFVRDVATRRTRRLSIPGDQIAPAVFGETVVWTDYRDGGADIYALDLATETERRLTGAPYDQTDPSISGDWVVYEDYGNIYNPRIHARQLVTGEVRTVDSGYGVRKVTPRVSGDLVVWEDWSSGGVRIKTYNLSTGVKKTIAPTPGAELQPSTDGRFVMYAVSGKQGLDVMMYDNANDSASLVAGTPGDQSHPILFAGRPHWLERRTSADESVIKTTRGAALPGARYTDGATVEQYGSVVEMRTGAGALAWMQRAPAGWRIGVKAPTASISQRVTMAGTRLRNAVLRTRAGLVTALADTTAPGPTNVTLARVSGSSSVEVRWDPSYDASSTVSYDLYRRPSPFTGGGSMAGAALVAGSVTATGTTVGLAADEASTSFTYHYSVVAKDSAGNTTGPSYSLAPNPHGTSSTSYNCRRCHPGAPHGAGGLYGAMGAKTREACYACHGHTSSSVSFGTASSLNTQRDSWDYDDQTGVVGARHRNSHMTSNQSECDACHDPHRTPYSRDASGTYVASKSYSQLLRVVLASDPLTYLRSTDSTPVGNAFCLDCHGSASTAMDIAGGVLAYVESGGDHGAAGNASMAHGPARIKANDTNPNIQCGVCHDQHASAGPKLIDYRGSETTSATAYLQAALCYRCHSASSTENTVAAGYSAPFAWNDRDVRSEFTTSTRVSRHPVTPSATGRSATCVNCHNVHYVREGAGAWDASRVVDPTNTKRFPTSISSFCVGCHSASPPVTTISDTVLVPYRVGFSSDSAWPYFTGWDKSAFTSAGHLAGATKTECSTCHDPHASASARLLGWTRPSAWTTGTPGTRNNTDTVLVREENVCYLCHGNNGSKGKQAPGAANIATMTALAYRHRPETTTGVHADTETSASLGGANRHNECVDCHDPHSAKKVGGTATQDALSSSLVGGAVYGAVGVQPSWGGAWTTPTSYAPRKLVGAAGDFEAYLCFKCHSGNVTIPANQTDLAREFNPNNPSYHNVLGQNPGMKSAFSFRASDGSDYTASWAIPTVAFLKNGMTSNTMLTCTSCHTNETAGKAKGPHGGGVAWLIDPAYPVDWKTVGLDNNASGISVDGSTDAATICAKCHDLYPACNGAHSQSAHYVGTTAVYLCIDCHIKIPHGWKRPRLLGSATQDPAAYATRSNALDKVLAVDRGAGVDHTLNKGAVSWGSSDCDTAGCQHNDDAMVFWP